MFQRLFKFWLFSAAAIAIAHGVEPPKPASTPDYEKLVAQAQQKLQPKLDRARESFLKILNATLDQDTKAGNVASAKALKREIDRFSDGKVAASTATFKNKNAESAQLAYMTVVNSAMKEHIGFLAAIVKYETGRKNEEIAKKYQEMIREAAGAPVDAKEFNNHYYKFIMDGHSWSESRQLCEDLNGYLACVETKEENEFLITTFGGIWGNNITVWIGGYEDKAKRKWHWISGAPFVSIEWIMGQPDNYKGEEDHLSYAKKANVKIAWNDMNQVGQHGCLCEWGY